MSGIELLNVQSVLDEAFWRIQSHWFVFFVEPFVFLRKNTNRHRCKQSGCVFSLPDTSQSKSVVLDLYDSVQWGMKCVWVFSIVVISCWCGLCTSIFFLVYWKIVRNNDEYPKLSIDTEGHLGQWEMISCWYGLGKWINTRLDLIPTIYFQLQFWSRWSVSQDEY